MPGLKDGDYDPSRRIFLKQMRWAPVLFVPAPICNPLFASELHRSSTAQTHFPFADVAFEPHYPAKSPLDDVLRMAAPGGDEFTFERYAAEIATLLEEWSRALRVHPPATTVLNRFVDRAIQSTSFIPIREFRLRSGGAIEVVRREFGTDMRPA